VRSRVRSSLARMMHESSTAATKSSPACCTARTTRKRVPPASSRAVLRVLEIRDYPSVHGVIEGANMRVIEAGDGSCLALKSLLQLGSL